MKSDFVALQLFEERLRELERQNRRLRKGVIAMLVLLGTLVVMAQAPMRRTIEANEFILRDANGNPRVKLSTEGSTHNAELIFFDEKGTIRAKIESGIFAGAISVFDPHGVLGVVVGGSSVARDGGHISVLDSTGHPKTTVSPGDIWVDGGVRLEDDDGFAAWLGKTGLLYRGESKTASAASLILVDNPHSKVIWKAP